jgi:hypothetical protein
MPSIAHLLRQSAVVSRASRAIVNGQVVETMAVVATVPCRITSPGRGAFALHAASEQAPRPRLAYFPPGTDIRPHDTVTVNAGVYRVTDAEPQPDAVYLAVSLERLNWLPGGQNVAAVNYLAPGYLAEGYVE